MLILELAWWKVLTFILVVWIMRSLHVSSKKIFQEIIFIDNLDVSPDFAFIIVEYAVNFGYFAVALKAQPIFNFWVRAAFVICWFSSVV